MLLQDYTDRGGWLPDFEILGTDLSEKAVRKAREGSYPVKELENIPGEKIRKLTEEHLADIVNGQRDFRF